jgi:hypothetical protein
MLRGFRIGAPAHAAMKRFDRGLSRFAVSFL